MPVWSPEQETTELKEIPEGVSWGGGAWLLKRAFGPVGLRGMMSVIAARRTRPAGHRPHPAQGRGRVGPVQVAEGAPVRAPRAVFCCSALPAQGRVCAHHEDGGLDSFVRDNKLKRKIGRADAISGNSGEPLAFRVCRKFS